MRGGGRGGGRGGMGVHIESREGVLGEGAADRSGWVSISNLVDTNIFAIFF